MIFESYFSNESQLQFATETAVLSVTVAVDNNSFKVSRCKLSANSDTWCEAVMLCAALMKDTIDEWRDPSNRCQQQ